MLKLSDFCSGLVNLVSFYTKYEVNKALYSWNGKKIYIWGPYFIEIGLEPNYGAAIIHDI